MKRETFRHPKTLDLGARLDVSRPQAIGHLTLLWDWATEVALSGDVGKWPNGSIARACDWSGDPDKFVNALVDAKWLDQDDRYRLVIHDWAQHCENWVRAKAQKLGVELLGQRKSESYDPVLRDVHKSGSLPCDRTEPNRTNGESPQAASGGNESNKKPKGKRKASAKPVDIAAMSLPAVLDTPDFRGALDTWFQYRSEKKRPLTETSLLALIKKFEQIGLQGSIERIDTAIANGWQGVVFQVDSNGPATKQNARPNGGIPNVEDELAARRQITGGQRT